MRDREGRSRVIGALTLAMSALSMIDCRGSYDAPPTRCDRWCQIVESVPSCVADDPTKCVASCEADSLGGSFNLPFSQAIAPACGAEQDALLDCFERTGLFMCGLFKGLQAGCETEFSALLACRNPETRECLAACPAWVAACGSADDSAWQQCLQACDFPGNDTCGVRTRSYAECQLAAPYECGSLSSPHAACASLLDATAFAPCGCSFTSCDGSCMFTALDPKNCGACGVVCPSGQSCRNSMCAP